MAEISFSAEKFFRRDTRKVARELLGKFLVRKIGGRKISAMITETEAYDGHRDRASHAARGRTERNKIMWGPPGHFYIYLCYGMHWMLNITARERGYPAAILIRSVQKSPRLIRTNKRIVLLNGPGKVTKFLKIGKSAARRLNGRAATRPASGGAGLWLEDRGVKIPTRQIKTGPRVGVAYAGVYWARKPWRFYLEKSFRQLKSEKPKQ